MAMCEGVMVEVSFALAAIESKKPCYTRTRKHLVRLAKADTRTMSCLARAGELCSDCAS